MEDRVQICVFAASSKTIDSVYVHAAYRLGECIAAQGWACVNGAGATGLMRAVTDGALDAGGHVVGVIPKFMVDNGWDYSRIPEVIITADMHERKQHMQHITQAVVALPGGCGTLEELLEVITWRQLGIISKPIVLLNTDGFFDPLISMLNSCARLGFMKPSHTGLWAVATEAEEAISIIAAELENSPSVFESKY